MFSERGARGGEITVHEARINRFGWFDPQPVAVVATNAFCRNCGSARQPTCLVAPLHARRVNRQSSGMQTHQRAKKMP